MYKHFFKRIFDFSFAFIVLIILLPIILILVVVIKIQQGGSIFYIQERPGRHGRIFRALKFKTMTDTKDQYGKLLPDKDRITILGSFMRSTSLDELPQLLNIVKGDMAVVGPRPLLVKYLPIYNEFQNRRHEVRPGITGWAQVNGRNNISWTRKFEFDVWYVDNLSFWLDIKIIVLTVKKVIKREGVSKEGFATTEAFNGKN
ncbi:MAG: sugar transferase [Bacteroidales bacterium]